MIRLLKPTTDYISQLQTYREQFSGNKKGIEGGSLLNKAESIEAWILQMEKNCFAETVQEGWVPAEQYIAVDEENGEVVGMLNLRKELTEVLLNYYGHIGYSVSPHHRRQGIATKMLELGLVEAKAHGMDRILITCADDNVGSYKVIENNGGVLEDKRVEPGDGKLTRRYWVTV